MRDPDLEQLRAATRAFAIAEVAPRAAELDLQNAWPDDLWKLVHGLGVTGVAFPASIGGGGGGYLEFVVMIEELARASAAAALLPAVNVLAARAVHLYGPPSLQARVLEGLVTGDLRACWAFTEPATGSDPKALTTRATRAAGGWRVSGTKSFISHSSVADVAVVFAKSSEGVTALCVDTHQPGFVPGARYDLVGLRGADTGDLNLDDAFAAEDAVLGTPGEGFDILLAVEAEAKVRSSAMCVGMAQAALDEALIYARHRLHRGVPIGEKFPTTQALIADIAVAAESARRLTYHAASELGTSTFARTAAMAKLHAATSARHAASLSMQVHGAYGYTNDYPIARIYRDAKAYEMIQGAAELQRVIVARSLLREASDG